jgi:hypothetical protein
MQLTPARARIGGVFLLVAAVAAASLWLIARAPGQDQRLSALRTAAGSRQPAREAPALQARLCRDPVPAAVGAVDARLRKAAAVAGLEVQDLRFEPLKALMPSDVTGAHLTMSVAGEEAKLLQFLKALAVQREALFLDRADLSVQGAKIEAVFDGRVLCRRGF